MATVRAFGALGITLLLAACQGIHASRSDAEDNVNFVIPLGSQVVLRQDLTLSAPRSAVYFQRGQMLSFHEVNEFLPYCLLQSRTPVPSNVIHAGEFRVRAVMREFLFSHLPATAYRLAAGQSFNPTYVLAT
ncbi:MAG: hypothetical protein R3268_11000, partial [Acidiferrobacterales bacterium]|nr:hypothetical protein [Acidiferrobacterales bacterium]